MGEYQTVKMKILIIKSVEDDFLKLFIFKRFVYTHRKKFQNNSENFHTSFTQLPPCQCLSYPYDSRWNHEINIDKMFYIYIGK